VSESKEAQLWRGPIEIVYTQQGLDKVLARLKDSKLIKKVSEQKKKKTQGRAASIEGPFGNRFILRRSTDEEFLYLSNPNHGIRPLSRESLPLGLSAITVRCKKGAAKPIAKFYLEVFRFPIRYDHNATGSGLARTTIIAANGAQFIYFQEEEGVDSMEDNGEHMAIYIGDFEGCFTRCDKLGLVWINPRFVHLDNTKTLNDALSSNAFRIRDIIDPASGVHLLRLEHEIRSSVHPSCPLNNLLQKKSCL